VAHLVEEAYGQAVGHVFLVAAPLMALAVIAILVIKEVPLPAAARDLGWPQ
jgi:hypothetical protein